MHEQLAAAWDRQSAPRFAASQLYGEPIKIGANPFYAAARLGTMVQ